MIDRELKPGRNIGTVICPVGSASSLVAKGWVSVRADGGATGTVWFQDSAASDSAPPGTGAAMAVRSRHAERQWAEIHNGTEYLMYDITCVGAGALAVELEAR